ncbi:MAG: ribosome maturation factor RimM [Dehalococcoidales bacterium]|nr:ribosome maturation factor RimM [Dehalococcoidales bacterium]
MKTSELKFIIIGQILAPWGDGGKLKIKVMTDFPQRFASSSIIYINQCPMTIDSTEHYKGGTIIKLKSVDTFTDAEKLRGKLIEIHYDQVHVLSEGQYYHFQLIGLEVWTTQNKLLGKITEVISGQSNDNYVVKDNEGEVLIPAIEDVVKTVDLDNGRVIIEPIKGLLDLNKKKKS